MLFPRRQIGYCPGQKGNSQILLGKTISHDKRALLHDHKTVSKSLRIDSDVALSLSHMARKLGVSESEYVSKALRRDILVEPLLQNIGGIGVSRALFMEMISRTDPTSLEIVASEIVKNNFPLALESLGMDLSLASINHFLKFVLEPIGWFKLERVAHADSCEFKFFHNYNYRWSRFLKACLVTMFEMIHEVPEIILLDRIVKLKLSKNSSIIETEQYEMIV